MRRARARPNDTTAEKTTFPPISHLVCRAKEGNMGEGSKSSRCPGKKLSGILRAKRCRAILSSPLLLLLLLLRPIRSDGHQMVPKLGGEVLESNLPSFRQRGNHRRRMFSGGGGTRVRCLGDGWWSTLLKQARAIDVNKFEARRGD